MFGTTDGQIIVMSSTGAMVSQVTVLEGMEITTLLWSCEKFNMEETESNRDSGVKVTADTGEITDIIVSFVAVSLFDLATWITLVSWFLLMSNPNFNSA